MLKGFSTKQLVFIALMSAFMFVINLIIGSGLIAITGIPLANAIVTGIVFGTFIILMVRTLPKFGTFTLFLLVYSLLEIPTSLGGAPGFWPKVPINVITGLAGDIFLLLFNYKRWTHFIGFYILITINTLVFVYFLSLFGIPGVDKLISMLWWILPLYWILGTIGIFIGEFIYGRIKKNKTYLQIKD